MINKELFVPMKIFCINFYVNLTVNTKRVVSPIREINLFENDGQIKVCITMMIRGKFRPLLRCLSCLSYKVFLLT